MKGTRVADRLQKLLGMAVLTVCCLLSSGRVLAVDLADAPLFIGGGAEPNIMFVLDDSGSMRWGFMPDSLDSNFNISRDCYGDNHGTYAGKYRCFYFSNNGRQFLASSYLNKQYYDPSLTYAPPPKGDGTSFPDASFSSAPLNGYFADSVTVDLSTQYRAIIDDYFYTNVDGFTVSHDGQEEPAFYFDFIDTVSGCVSDPYSDACYSKVNVASQTVEEQQNFANWFSYYRTRDMSAKAGIGKAFDTVTSAVRVGYGRLNKAGTLESGVSDFLNDTNRKSFFSWLYGVDPTGSTPLRTSLNDVGQYYSRTDDEGPYSSTPGAAGGENYECRPSYSVLMTDGYWGGNSPGVGNQDGTSGPTLTGPNGESFTYSAESPFTDDYNNTLADVAMKYWKNDLQPDLLNGVPASDRNPAFWQHMVTYGVGLGVTGGIDPDSAFAAIGDSTVQISWNDPAASDSAKIDDLLHASVNSRGGFFSATDPGTFAAELSGVLNDIISRGTTSSASIVANSTRLDTDSLIYQARFNPERWSGDLLAFALEENGDVKSSPKWSAADKLDAMELVDRKVLAGTTNGLVALDATHVGGDANLAAWLKGDRSQEQSQGGSLRTRDSRLGDIVNSNPAYSGRQSYGYQHMSDATQAQKYNVFKASQNNRREVVLVAANDGMVHAFDADQGGEVFSYAPSFVLDDLARLADPDYSHEYFLDGSIVVTDAWLESANDGGANGGWRTLAVGTAGAAGRGIYVLDITDPNSPSLIWEVETDANGYMGEGITEVAVVPTTIPGQGSDPDTTKWVVAAANGYNSSDGTARLLMFDLEDGSLDETVPVGVAGGNGLSGVTVIDADGSEPVADTIYGGDLNGDLWKFNQDKNGIWQSALGTSPLFDGITSRPITARPDVAKVALEEDADPVTMVYFGTGKYLGVTDVSDLSVQSLYGIIDSGSTLTQGDLLEQTIEFQGEVKFDGNQIPVRAVSDNVPDDNNSSDDDGWYLELIYNNNQEGERSVVRPVIHETAILFTTLIPSDDPCSGGGNSWVMALDKGTGGRVAGGVFDLNDDGVVDEKDFVNQASVPASGFGSDKLLTRPNVLGGPGGVDVVHSSDSSGDVTRFNIKGSGALLGRHSWRQIR